MPNNATENIYSTEYGGSGAPIPASKISYDNTESGLLATNIQGAIDEIDTAVDELVGDKLPILPDEATAGTYVLKATKVDDTVTYSWVAEV